MRELPYSVVLLGALLGLTACGSPPRGPASQTQLQVPSRPAKLLEVTEFFGPARVQAGTFFAESPVKPWSAWWYPLREKHLFEREGRRSTLEKLDEYLALRNLQTGVVEFERASPLLYNESAQGWEGRCNAWALASLLEPEPVRNVVAGGIVFDVGDLKALLIKNYEETDGIESFGQRNYARRDTVWDDIFPDQFHRFIQVELFEQGRPFMMDDDAGPAVWNTPVWMAEFKIEDDQANANRVKVTADVLGASPLVDTFDYRGTKATRYSYTYDLYGDRQPDGSLIVKYGEWTGESLDHHPDFVARVPDNPLHRSRNTLIDPAIVNELVKPSIR